MYAKKAQGWMKHLDFIILDMICLHLSYFCHFGNDMH